MVRHGTDESDPEQTSRSRLIKSDRAAQGFVRRGDDGDSENTIFHDNMGHVPGSQTRCDRIDGGQADGCGRILKIDHLDAGVGSGEGPFGGGVEGHNLSATHASRRPRVRHDDGTLHSEVKRIGGNRRKGRHSGHRDIEADTVGT